jgi:hypothetical protein
VDDLFRSLPLAAICQYRTDRFGAPVLSGALRTHRIVVAHGAVCANPHHLPPAEFLGPSDPAAEVERMLDALVPCRPSEQARVCPRCGGVPQADGWRRFEDFAADRFGLRLARTDCPECRRRLAGPV